MLVLLIIKFLIIFALYICVCVMLPRRYNKYIFIKYGNINLINLMTNIKGFIIVAIGTLIIFGNYRMPMFNVISIIIGIIMFCYSTYICSVYVIKSNLSSGDKKIGYVISILSMVVIIVEIFSLANGFVDGYHSTFYNVFDCIFRLFCIVTWKPDL